MDVIDFIIMNLPADARHKTGGNYELNCQSCGRVEQTGKNDTRHRGGLRINASGFTYHCFNCGYKCGYTVGQYMSSKAKQLFIDMGWDDGMMSRLKELVFKHVTDDVKDSLKSVPFWKPRTLPTGYVKITDSIKAGRKDTNFLKIVEYMNKRNPDMINWVDFYWNHFNKPSFAFKCYENEKEVGYIIRNIDSEPKYKSFIPPNYMFNFDKGITRKINVITEGVLDAISIDGIGLLGNNISEEKREKIKQLMTVSKVIYVPDRDSAGLKAVSDLMRGGFEKIYISCPEWDSSIKDPFDAVAKYGRIYTLKSIIDNASILSVGYLKAMNWIGG